MYTMTSFMNLLFCQEPYFTLQKGSLSFSTKQLKVATSKCPLAMSRKSICSYHEAPMQFHLVCMQLLVLLYILYDLKWRKPSAQRIPMNLSPDHYRFFPAFKLMAICHKKSSSSHFYSAASQGLDWWDQSQSNKKFSVSEHNTKMWVTLFASRVTQFKEHWRQSKRECLGIWKKDDHLGRYPSSFENKCSLEPAGIFPKSQKNSDCISPYPSAIISNQVKQLLIISSSQSMINGNRIILCLTNLFL